MGIAILAVVLVMMFFGFGERLLRGTGVPYWLAFIISVAFIAAFFIPEIKVGKVIVNAAGFILPFLVSVLFSAMIGFKLPLVRALLSMAAVGASVFAVRMLCMNLKENSVTVATLVSGFLSGLIGYFISGKARGMIASVMGGVVIGDFVFALIDYYVYNADAIYLGLRGSYNTVIIGSVLGLLISGLLSAVIRTLNAKKAAKHLSFTESAEDVTIDKAETEEFNSFFDDEII